MKRHGEEKCVSIIVIYLMGCGGDGGRYGAKMVRKMCHGVRIATTILQFSKLKLHTQFAYTTVDEHAKHIDFKLIPSSASWNSRLAIPIQFHQIR